MDYTKPFQEIPTVGNLRLRKKKSPIRRAIKRIAKKTAILGSAAAALMLIMGVGAAETITTGKIALAIACGIWVGLVIAVNWGDR